MEIDALAIAAFLASQALQTLQLWAVNRKVSKTLAPPPLPAMPPPAAVNPFCVNCGTLTAPSQLRNGLCVGCLESNPTDRPYGDLERRRRR